MRENYFLVHVLYAYMYMYMYVFGSSYIDVYTCTIAKFFNCLEAESDRDINKTLKGYKKRQVNIHVEGRL